MKHLRIFFFAVIAVFSFSLASATFAQTNGTGTAANAAISAEALADEQVTEADLNVEKAVILPDSALYGFKRFGRSIRRAFIFDNAKKIERDIKDVNQELADLNRLVPEKKGSVSNSTLKAFDSIEKRFDAIAKRAPELANKGMETRRAVMERLLDSEIKRQKLFERIENTVKDERILERAQETRERMMEKVGTMMEKVTVDEKLIDKVLKEQKGSEFKDLRNLEVLKRLEEKVPEEAQRAIQQAEENAFKRLNAQMKNNKDKMMNDRLGEYVKDFGGDQTIRLEILNTLKNTIPPGASQRTLRLEVKEAQDLSAIEIKNELKEKSERLKESEGFDPGPVGKEKPGSEAEKKGLIPLPSGKPTNNLEQKGLIPLPSGDTGPGTDQPKPQPSPISNRKDSGSDLEKKGLIPIPSGKPQNETEKKGIAPLPSPSPRSGGSDLEKKGLIPIPSGDTGPGGNSGPSPAPKRR